MALTAVVAQSMAHASAIRGELKGNGNRGEIDMVRPVTGSAREP